jgi:hypothetical protein
MCKLRFIFANWAFTLLVVCGTAAGAAAAGDLSRYRDFQFGTDLPTVAGQVGASVSQAKTIYSRPALVQELEWRPQSLGASVQKESANEVVFSFYNSQLYRIEVKYDRYEIEGLTSEDIVEAVSSIYGPTAKLAAAPAPTENHYGDKEQVVARWQDSQYRFELIRSSYGLGFGLVGVLTRLEAPAQAAIAEAQRLDIEEAPQRDAARQASEQEAVKAKLEKSRLVNKPRFRP